MQVTETMTDLVMSRERKLSVCCGLFRDRVGDLMRMISSGGALVLENGDEVWSYCDFGGQKSAYIQRGKIVSLEPDAAAVAAAVAAGSYEDQRLVAVAFAGVSQLVPRSYIVDKVDSQLDALDLSLQVEEILAPLKNQITHLLANPVQSPSSLQRDVSAREDGHGDDPAAPSSGTAAAGAHIHRTDSQGADCRATRAGALELRVDVLEGNLARTEEELRRAEARVRNAERAKVEMEKLVAALEERVANEEAEREHLVSQKAGQCDVLAQQVSVLEASLQEAQNLTCVLREEKAQDLETITKLQDQVKVHEQLTVSELPVAQDPEEGQADFGSGAGDASADWTGTSGDVQAGMGGVEDFRVANVRADVGGGGEKEKKLVVALSALDEEVRALRKERDENALLVASQSNTIAGLQALLDASEHQRQATSAVAEVVEKALQASLQEAHRSKSALASASVPTTGHSDSSVLQSEVVELRRQLEQERGSNGDLRKQISLIEVSGRGSGSDTVAGDAEHQDVISLRAEVSRLQEEGRRMSGLQAQLAEVQAELEEERKKVGGGGGGGGDEGEEVEKLRAQVEEERKKGEEEGNKVSGLQAQLAEVQAELEEERKKAGRNSEGAGEHVFGAQRATADNAADGEAEVPPAVRARKSGAAQEEMEEEEEAAAGEASLSSGGSGVRGVEEAKESVSVVRCHNNTRKKMKPASPACSPSEAPSV